MKYHVLPSHHNVADEVIAFVIYIVTISSATHTHTTTRAAGKYISRTSRLGNLDNIVYNNIIHVCQCEQWYRNVA